MIGLKEKLIIKNNKRESGTSLYLAVIVLIVLLAIVLGLTSILVGQMRMVREMGYSVIALSAADAGIETILVDRNDPLASPAANCIKANPCGLSNQAEYYLKILSKGEEHCTEPDWNYCIISTGEYEGVRRSIEIVY